MGEHVDEAKLIEQESNEYDCCMDCKGKDSLKT
jgi:hypothetical protein